MPTELSSLRVTADMDTSAYTRAMQEKIAADKAGAASSAAVGEAAVQAGTAMTTSGGALGRLSRSYIDGYASVSKFEKEVRALARAIDSNAPGMVRTGTILEGIYRRYGQAADATRLLADGHIELAAAVTNLNAKYAAQNEVLERNAQVSQRVAQAQRAQTDINSRLGIVAGGGGTRGADIEAYGGEMDRLRAKFSPMFALEQKQQQALADISHAYRVGAISQKEYESANDRANASAAREVAALNGSAHAHRTHGEAVYGNQLQMQEFLHIGRSLIDDVASGNLTRGIFQETGRLQIALSSGEGGAAGALSRIGSGLATLLNPVTLVTAGIAALGIAAVYSFTRWEAAQDRAFASLQGRGRGSGFTMDSFNAAAMAGAQRSNMSDNQARTALADFTGTGRIGSDLATQLLGQTRQFSRASGLDIGDAGKELSKAFGGGNLTQGLDALNDRVGGFDDKTRHLVGSLHAQGDILGAQRALFDGLAHSTEGASTRLEMYSDRWTQFKNKISNTADSFGKSIAAALGDVSMEDHIKTLQDFLLTTPTKAGVRGYAADHKQREEAYSELDALNASEIAAAAKKKSETEEFRAQQRSLDVGNSIRGVLPDVTRREDLQNKTASFQGALNDPLVMSHLGMSVDDVNEALGRLGTQLQYFATASQAAAQESTLSASATMAWTANQKAAIEGTKAYLDVIRSSGDSALASATAFGRLNDSIAASNKSAEDAARRAGDHVGDYLLSPIQRRMKEIDLQYRDDLRNDTTRADFTTAFGNGVTNFSEAVDRFAGKGGEPIALPGPGALTHPHTLTPATAYGPQSANAYFAAVAAHESGGNSSVVNQTTGAAGLYQFTPPTWRGLMRSHPELHLTPGGATDPAQSARAMSVFTAENSAALARAGLSTDPQHQFMAHFLGAAGATSFFRNMAATPNASAASLFPREAAQNANDFYSKGAPRSFAELYSHMTATMPRAGDGSTIPATSPGSRALWYDRTMGEAQNQTVFGNFGQLGRDLDVRDNSLVMQQATVGMSPDKVKTATEVMDQWNRMVSDATDQFAKENGLMPQVNAELQTYADRLQKINATQQDYNNRLSDYNSVLSGARDTFHDSLSSLTDDLTDRNRQDIIDKLTLSQRNEFYRDGGQVTTSVRLEAALDDIKASLSKRLIGAGTDQLTNLAFGRPGQGGGLIGGPLGEVLGPIFGVGGRSMSAQVFNAGTLNVGAMTSLTGGLASSAGGATGGSGSILGNFFGGIFGGGGAAAATSSSASLGFFAGPHAAGGMISGPGGPRSDSIMLRASNGEYVVNAAATSMHLGLLDDINSGRLPAYADGGYVGPQRRSGGGAATSIMMGDTHIHMTQSQGTTESDKREQKQTLKALLDQNKADTIRELVAALPTINRRQGRGYPRG